MTVSRQLGRDRAGVRAPAHQARLLSRQRAYCRALASANRALSWEDCEDVFAETIERDAPRLPPDLSPRDAHHWFSRRLQQRAVDFLRHRDGRRESEKARRPRFVSLEGPAGDGGQSTLAAVLPDGDVDVSGDVLAKEDRDQAVLAARTAMQRLKPLEQRLLKLRYELPDASMPELATICGLTVDQAGYRLRVAVQKFKKALSSGRLGPECDVARGALRLGADGAPPDALARARAHVAGCWMCRAWQLEHAAIAWLPFPAFTKLEWLAARLEARLRPLAPVPETAAGATAAGGASLTLGAGKLAALCSAGAVTATVCVNVLTSPPDRPERRPASTPSASPTAAPRLAGSRTAPTPKAQHARSPSRNTTTRREPQRKPTGQIEVDTREVEVARPAAAPVGTNEFLPGAAEPDAPPPPAEAPAAGGGEFLP